MQPRPAQLAPPARFAGAMAALAGEERRARMGGAAREKSLAFSVGANAEATIDFGDKPKRLLLRYAPVEKL